MTFAGRVEAKITVPSGGAAASVSIGAKTAAVTVTTPAASYYHTAAGGIASWATTFQGLLNGSALQFPDNASAVQAMLGYGSWGTGAAWLCQETSGNLAAAFGSPTLTATTLTYQNAGVSSGDYAIGFSAATSNADGGANFDVAANDLIVAYIGKWSALPGGNVTTISKMAAGGASGWAAYGDGSVYGMFTQVSAGAGFLSTVGSAGYCVGEWHAAIGVVDRSTGKMRFGTIGLTSGTATISTETAVAGNFTTAATFRVGASAWVNTSTSLQISACYVVAGSSVATGLSVNLSTALTNLRNAINSTFTVALDTASQTGRYTISNSFWPFAINFTNTTQRDLAGYAYDVDYPQTPAQVATALGYGNFANGAGWLLNEAAGNPAPIFGSPTLTATSLTYSNIGARGGADKAIGFSAGGGKADGGSVFNALGTDDIIIAWAGYFTAVPGGIRSAFSKYNGAAAGWQILIDNSVGNYYFQGFDSGAVQQFSTFSLAGASVLAKQQHVGIAVIDRSTGKARIGTMSLLPGASPSVTNEVTALTSSMSNAIAFRIGDRGDNPGIAPTEATFGAVYVVTGAGVATGLSANLSSALSSFATYMRSQTSTKSARGCWFPDCTTSIDMDPYQAPIDTDARQTESPNRSLIGLVGNAGYVHTGLAWSHSPKNRIWESAVTYANQSYEQFIKDTQIGQGLSWFQVTAPVQIYTHDGTVVGGAFNSGAGISGWQIKSLKGVAPKAAIAQYMGLWRVEWPEITSSG